jgi:hypothetical protein
MKNSKTKNKDRHYDIGASKEFLNLVTLKVSKRENFRLTDFRYFCTTKPLWVGNFWDKLKKLLANHSNSTKTQYRKFETNIPRKGIALPQSQFPQSCVCERFIYSQDRSAYSAAGKNVDPSWEYINRSQTQECGKWDLDSAIPFLVEHKWDFRCSAVRLGQLI